MTNPRHPNLGSDTWKAFLVIVGAWLLAAIGLFNEWLLAPDSLPDDQCAGLGFGCVLTPQDNIQFMALLFGVPATIAWFSVGAIATTLLGRFSNLKWWWIGLLSLGICLRVVAATLKAVERMF